MTHVRQFLQKWIPEFQFNFPGYEKVEKELQKAMEKDGIFDKKDMILFGHHCSNYVFDRIDGAKKVKDSETLLKEYLQSKP